MTALVNAETGELVATITKDEAALLTARIKGHVADAWILLSEAHERKAYLAMGYKTWADYVTKEFELSRSESYRLLDQAKVIHELEDGLIAASWDVSRARDISGRAAAALADVPGPEAKAEVFIEATEANGGETPTGADITVTIEQSSSPAVRAIRERREAKQKAEAEQAQPAPVPVPLIPDHLAIRMEGRKVLDPIAARLQATDFAELVDAYNHGDEIDKAYLPRFVDVLRKAADALDKALTPTLRGL